MPPSSDSEFFSKVLQNPSQSSQRHTANHRDTGPSFVSPSRTKGTETSSGLAHGSIQCRHITWMAIFALFFIFLYYTWLKSPNYFELQRRHEEWIKSRKDVPIVGTTTEGATTAAAVSQLTQNSNQPNTASHSDAKFQHQQQQQAGMFFEGVIPHDYAMSTYPPKASLETTILKTHPLITLKTFAPVTTRKRPLIGRTLRILLISDTHSMEMPQWDFFPEADLCIHTGDFTSGGTLKEILEFYHWFKSLRCTMGRFVVSGNNDFIFKSRHMWSKEDLQTLFGNDIKYLRDDTVRLVVGRSGDEGEQHDGGEDGNTVEETSANTPSTAEEIIVEPDASQHHHTTHEENTREVVIYGAPWLMNNYQQLLADAHLKGKPTENIANLSNQFFFLSDEERAKKWSAIPEDTNILLTHAPSYGILDVDSLGRRRGDSYLRSRIDELRELDMHLQGHIHGSEGVLRDHEVLRVNAVYLYSKIGYYFEYKV